MRDKTHAQRTLNDNVPHEVKQRRLRELIDCYQMHVHAKNSEREVGRLRLVLVEGPSKKQKGNTKTWTGRTDQNKRILFPVDEVDDRVVKGWTEEDIKPILDMSQAQDIEAETARSILNRAARVAIGQGDYAVVKVTEAKGHTLRGQLLWRATMEKFANSGLSGMDAESLQRGLLIQDWLAYERNSDSAAAACL
jgi:tRNA A37 methylthiotransferase MiaB